MRIPLAMLGAVCGAVMLAGCTVSQEVPSQYMGMHLVDAKICTAAESSAVNPRYSAKVYRYCHVTLALDSGQTITGDIASNAEIGDSVALECHSKAPGGHCYARPLTVDREP